MELASSPRARDSFEPSSIITLRSITFWLFYEYQAADKPCSRICSTVVLHILSVDSIATHSEILPLTPHPSSFAASLINYQLPRPPFVFALSTRVLSRLISYTHAICMNSSLVNGTLMKRTGTRKFNWHCFALLGITGLAFKRMGDG